MACGDRHCCAILTVSAVQALSRRQEERGAGSHAAWLSPIPHVKDNVLCWGDDFHQQLQVPGKDRLVLIATSLADTGSVNLSRCKEQGRTGGQELGVDSRAKLQAS